VWEEDLHSGKIINTRPRKDSTRDVYLKISISTISFRSYRDKSKDIPSVNPWYRSKKRYYVV
jgi:hypothetical protein